ncbi:MAG: hypothetical protein M1333_00495 [Patescibacteria group bacterium]|nr:hypothetical protein [Patescibacteria group bacterium]
MENQNPPAPVSQEQILQEILENTQKTKKYIQWQLYITVALVVIPLIAMVAIVPMVLRSVGNMYGSVLQ